jgi:hypothetical protein
VPGDASIERQGGEDRVRHDEETSEMVVCLL